MPDHPRLKLCGVCDQVSLARARGTSRNPRCSAPVPPAGARCGSRQVRFLTLRELNEGRLATSLRITALETSNGNHEARISELEEMFADLRRRSR